LPDHLLFQSHIGKGENMADQIATDIIAARARIAAYTPPAQRRIDFLTALRARYVSAVQNGDTNAVAQVIADLREQSIDHTTINVP
jgi:uncharacterized protein involved in exopolysaccharide biosynthesis